MVFYHGSALNIEYIQPSVDPRTGIYGVWLTDIKEHALIYAFLKQSSSANVNWSSSGGVFTEALVTTSQDNVVQAGYIYTVNISEGSVRKIAEHSYISLDPKLKVLKKVPVTIDCLAQNKIKLNIVSGGKSS